MKDAFQILSKGLRNRNILLERRKYVLLYNHLNSPRIFVARLQLALKKKWQLNKICRLIQFRLFYFSLVTIRPKNYFIVPSHKSMNERSCTLRTKLTSATIQIYCSKLGNENITKSLGIISLIIQHQILLIEPWVCQLENLISVMLGMSKMKDSTRKG